jgi:hypothetical protein
MKDVLTDGVCLNNPQTHNKKTAERVCSQEKSVWTLNTQSTDRVQTEYRQSTDPPKTVCCYYKTNGVKSYELHVCQNQTVQLSFFCFSCFSVSHSQLDGKSPPFSIKCQLFS